MIMIQSRIQLWAVIFSFLLLFVIIELIRRKNLKERYSLLWLITGGIFLILSLALDYWTPVVQFFGFFIPSNALFTAAFLFLTLISLGMTVALSNLSEKNRRLTQELVFLKKRVEDLEKGNRVSEFG